MFTEGLSETQLRLLPEIMQHISMSSQNKTGYRASFYTLGCRLNQAETSLISNSFQEKGYEIVEYGQPTDLCVINTCTVTEQADSKCRQLVRQVLKRSPEAFVAVVGCYAQLGAESLSEIEGVDMIIGTEEKMKVSNFIDIPQKLPEPIIRNGKISREPFTISSVCDSLCQRPFTQPCYLGYSA